MERRQEGLEPLDRAERSVWSVFGNCGQDCCARSRPLVEQVVYEDFVAAIAKRTEQLRMGQPLDESTEIGPMISADQRRTSLGYLEAGQQEGARLVSGGTVPEVPGATAGSTCAPRSSPT
jgi:acyl-CoA reductase-like NAD-dependent aldehyde dehydrogenase